MPGNFFQGLIGSFQQNGCFAIGLNVEWTGQKERDAFFPVQDGYVHGPALVAFADPSGAPAPGRLRLQPEPKKKFRYGETKPELAIRARARGLQRTPSAGHGAAVRMPRRDRAGPGAPQGGAAAGRPARDRECACASLSCWLY